MEKYLKSTIKEIIAEFPPVAQALGEYNIGCVGCSVGSCLLKDIVDIHNLSQEDNEALLTRIGQIIAPGQVVKLPAAPKKSKQASKALAYSPPLRQLVDEHALIKRFIALVPWAVKNLDLHSTEGRQLALESLDFIRSFADRLHHAKEEDILFKYFDQNSDIIKAMLEDHATGRNHVKAALEAVEKKDSAGFAERLGAYAELLTGHIKKEDEILYPWMDRNLSVTQVGELFEKFRQADGASGKGAREKWEKFVKEAECKAREVGRQ